MHKMKYAWAGALMCMGLVACDTELANVQEGQSSSAQSSSVLSSSLQSSSSSLVASSSSQSALGLDDSLRYVSETVTLGGSSNVDYGSYFDADEIQSYFGAEIDSTNSGDIDLVFTGSDALSVAGLSTKLMSKGPVSEDVGMLWVSESDMAGITTQKQVDSIYDANKDLAIYSVAPDVGDNYLVRTSEGKTRWIIVNDLFGSGGSAMLDVVGVY